MADKLGRDRLNPPKIDHRLNGGPAQLAILSLLRRRPILPTKYVGALQSSSHAHRQLLTQMVQQGYLYHPKDSLRVDRLKLLNRDMLWSLTKAGDEFYERIGGTEPHRNFNSYYDHAVGVSIVGALFDIFAKEHGLTLTLLASKPEKWGTLLPDEPPFIIENGTRKVEFLGFEYDRATETLSTISEKLDAYANYLESDQHGMKNPFVPIITTSQERLNNIKNLLVPYGKTASRFILTWLPKFEDNTFPSATGNHVELWQRLDSSLNLGELLWTSKEPASSLPKSRSENLNSPV